jgi:anaerobic ribonucleoside-triphosphate reductase activating protein
MIALRIAGIDKDSIVDGPGLRYVIFTQGCKRRCAGCHNPHTQDLAGGYEVDILELLKPILEAKMISGVTFSGGEPFLQAKACSELARLIKEKRPELNIVSYSGNYYDELLEMAKIDPAIKDFLGQIDVLIDGPFDETQKSYNLPFRGSKNQSIIELFRLKTPG